MTVAVALLFGAAGAYLGNRFRVPAGILVGTLVGVAVAVGVGGALLGLPQVPTPPGTNALLQICLGMLVGFRISRDELRSGAHALLPAALVTAIITSTGVVVALVAASLTSIDTITAVFAAVPGGLTEMSAVSLSFGADGAAVASVQLVRVLLAIAAVDALLAWLGPKEEDEDKDEKSQEQNVSAESTGYAEDLKRLGVALSWGILGGLAGIASQIPAGGIIGALAGSTAFRLLTGRPVPVRAFQLGVQVLAGAVIGLQVSGEFFGQLARLAGAGALIVSVQMLLWPLMSWMLARLFGYDLATAALAATPGGLSGVVATASEAQADEVVVTFVHLVRLSTIVVVVPVFVTLFFR